LFCFSSACRRYFPTFSCIWIIFLLLRVYSMLLFQKWLPFLSSKESTLLNAMNIWKSLDSKDERFGEHSHRDFQKEIWWARW
jgi:hypothetical protein